MSMIAYRIVCSWFLLVLVSQVRAVEPEGTAALAWMQLSAEYSAVCEQTYSNALEKVTQGVAEQKESNGKPLAVIMDLDETVLDNSKYQVYMNDLGLKPSVESFAVFVSSFPGAVNTVPGAKRFIKGVEKQGVSAVFVSNRPETIRRATIRTLVFHNILPSRAEYRDRLLLMEDGMSDKNHRFREVLRRYKVVAWIGDQLGDFPVDIDVPRGAPVESRRLGLQPYALEFGTNWFILPNPVYGDWLRNFESPISRRLLRVQANEAGASARELAH